MALMYNFSLSHVAATGCVSTDDPLHVFDTQLVIDSIVEAYMLHLMDRDRTVRPCLVASDIIHAQIESELDALPDKSEPEEQPMD